MIREPLSNRYKMALGILAMLVLIGGYTYVSHLQHEKNPNDTTIPSWSQLYHGVQKIIEVNPRDHGRWIVIDSAATGRRLLLGFAAGVFGAFLLGTLMGCFGVLEGFFVPPLSFLAKIPPTAMLAVFFVLVGIELKMYVSMIAFGVLPTLALSHYHAVKDVSEQALHKAYTIGASHAEVIWNVIVRQTLPAFLKAVMLQIGPAIVYLIAAEMVCASEGFGYRIRLEFKKLNMDVVYPYLVVLAGAGYLFHGALRLTLARACPWYRNGRS